MLEAEGTLWVTDGKESHIVAEMPKANAEAAMEKVVPKVVPCSVSCGCALCCVERAGGETVRTAARRVIERWYTPEKYTLDETFAAMETLREVLGG